MNQPIQNLCDARKLGPLRQDRTVDHQHRKAKRPRRVQLGARTCAARVSGHNQLRAVAPHQRPVTGFSKRSPCHHHMGIRQGQPVGFIHKAQQVVMLTLSRKHLKMHAANSQKNALRFTRESVNRCRDILHMVPCISGLRYPHLSRQRDQRDQGFMAGPDRIPAHLCREGMSCIHNMGKCVFANKCRKAIGATKSPNADRQWLRAGLLHATGIGINSRNSLFSNGLRQSIRLGRATKNQEVGHV